MKVHAMGPRNAQDIAFPMARTRVGIIFGGKSSEHEVSLQSAKNILDALDRERFEPVLVGIDKQGQWHLSQPDTFLINADDPSLIALHRSGQSLAVRPGAEQAQLQPSDAASALGQIDVVLPIVHGPLGEDGALQGLLRMINLPFVGSPVLGSAVAMDKDVTKRLLRDAGLQVAPWLCIRRHEAAEVDADAVIAQLGLPLFVKPANQGSSVGVSKVKDAAGFAEALALALRYDHNAGGIGGGRPRDRMRGAGQRAPAGQRMRRGGGARRVLRLRHQVHQCQWR